MAGPVTYNLDHSQVMSLVGSGNDWLKVMGTTTLTPSVSSSPTYLAADGSKPYAAYPAAEWSISGGFAEGDFAILSVLNGGLESTSGTPGTDEIKRYEQAGTVSNPPFALSGYMKNVNGRVGAAGMRVTFPSLTASPAFPAMGQETWGEWSWEGAATPDENDVVVIYETLEASPVFTDGVYVPNLEAPAP